MASRADNIASNLSLANFSKATELKKRIWFTLGALIVAALVLWTLSPGLLMLGQTPSNVALASPVWP